MTQINHYKANVQIRYVYSGMEERLRELEAFLSHVHHFVTKSEERIGEDLQLYSQDFFEYFYAGTYGYTFRASFIVTLSSIIEGYIKEFLSAWKNIFQAELADLKWNNSILDLLKEADKTYLQIKIDFTSKAIVDFRGLLAVRNAIVHSNGNTEYVGKYVPLIRQLLKAYPSFEFTSNGLILTSEQFCKDAMAISKCFFFYISKRAIRKFPEYRAKRPIEEGV